MTAESSDSELLRRSLSEPTRFEAIYERHLTAIYLYLRRRVGDHAAEDLASEVFVRAFRSRARYNAEHPSALPWLFGIASNLIGDQRRAERKRLKTLERLASTSKHSSIAADEVYLGTTLSPELYRAVRKLNPGDRDALLLVAWGELSYEETAQALQIPVGTVRSRIARARRQLQLTIRAEGPTGPDTRPSSAPVVEEGGTHV